MKILTWTNIRLLLMFILVIFLYSFTSYRNNHRKIKKVEVEILDNNTPFIKSEMVNKLLIEKNSNAKTFTKETLVLKKLENSINEQKLIQKADVFVSVDGVLKAVVKQKTPLGRVSTENRSFYIDYEGNEMPFSDNYTARVPLISGDINGVKKEKLALVLRTIFEDEFLKKNIIGVQVLPNGSLILENRNYDFRIDFGRTINVERKFNNYKAFFQKAVSDSTLNKYKMINLKFTQQVVCIK
ncbi:cell division protein FtsQ [Flavobacterium capsici]|uniref:Cell division protein FtsQ n=1 Tax=Flavobacterium capsici TaxID=3075618 RepID=A0AA96F3C4_9FLAO|nr:MULTISPECIES: cell division protein FtsQ [unclassified Flavobacterium]WNM19181.1 cell division protein FtsQ [Flavobacterium sp. PMR2A8]WNM20570.1 cell division protein FtsQ [Flavobacterium sp. PMTSA4]